MLNEPKILSNSATAAAAGAAAGAAAASSLDQQVVSLELLSVANKSENSYLWPTSHQV